MDWDRLRIFHDVADAGSFTHAGATLNLSQSAVSRQVSALEDSLSVKLFHRHARGLILTEQGELLYQTVKDVFHKLAIVESQLSETRENPTGPLKVTTTVSFGSTWLTPRIKEFIEMYPEVDFSLILTDTELDLGMRQADIGIRLTPPRQPDLIQRHLLALSTHIYGAKQYLDEHGVPKTAKDLDDHNLIVYGHDVPPPVPSVNWLLDAGATAPRRPALRVNNIYGIYRAARSGLGLASLPDYMIPDDVNLVKVLPDLAGPSIQAYFVYPEELRHSKRIAVFRDFLLQKIAESRS
ncbi:MAG: LysR family transcriptional regulator [Alphaproteobacteria bacterium]|nr:LysR family transcriptional regulator [Alphaproteobacteria bacterium]